MAKYDLNVMPVVDEGGAPPRRDHDRRRHRRPHARADRGRAEARRRRAARHAVFRDELLDVHPQARRCGSSSSSSRSSSRRRRCATIEPVLEAVDGAFLYVPLLISAGGNSGSQSSTLIIRGLALGEIKLKDWWRIAGRELGQGLALGLIFERHRRRSRHDVSGPDLPVRVDDRDHAGRHRRRPGARSGRCSRS